MNHYYYKQVDNRILRLPGHIFVVLYFRLFQYEPLLLLTG